MVQQRGPVHVPVVFALRPNAPAGPAGPDSGLLPVVGFHHGEKEKGGSQRRFPSQKYHFLLEALQGTALHCRFLGSHHQTPGLSPSGPITRRGINSNGSESCTPLIRESPPLAYGSGGVFKALRAMRAVCSGPVVPLSAEVL